MSGEPKWKEIKITNQKPSELKDMEINLEDDNEEEVEDNGNNERPNPKANDRPTERVQVVEENKNSTTRTQVQPRQAQNATQRSQVNDTDEEDQPQGQSRRARRIRFLNNENQQLKDRLAQLEQANIQARNTVQRTQAASVTSQKKLYERLVNDKTTEYENAVSANDAKAQAKALRELNDAQIKFQVYEAAESELPDEQEEEVQPQRQPTQQPPPPPQAAVRWVDKNQWFMTNSTAHIAARKVNAELHQEGFDPNTDEFYEELEARLVDDGLDLKKLRGETQVQSRPNGQAPVQKRRSPVGGSEGDTGENMNNSGRTAFKREGNKVLVTPTTEDREWAETMGTDIESYMKNKLIYEETGGKGYTPIIIRKKS